MRTGILGSRAEKTVRKAKRLRQGEGVLLVIEVIAPEMMRKNQPTLATNPTIPNTRPITASVPPPNAPPLVAIRCREMNPMIAAAGPRRTPKHPSVHTTERMPTIRDAIARPSLRGAAYPADMGAYPPGRGRTHPPPLGGGGGGGGPGMPPPPIGGGGGGGIAPPPLGGGGGGGGGSAPPPGGGGAGGYPPPGGGGGGGGGKTDIRRPPYAAVAAGGPVLKLRASHACNGRA